MIWFGWSYWWIVIDWLIAGIVPVCVLQAFPKTDIMLDNEMQGSGVYNPEMDEPEYCNPQSTSLWELHTLKVHTHTRTHTHTAVNTYNTYTHAYPRYKYLLMYTHWSIHNIHTHTHRCTSRIHTHNAHTHTPYIHSLMGYSSPTPLEPHMSGHGCSHHDLMEWPLTLMYVLVHWGDASVHLYTPVLWSSEYYLLFTRLLFHDLITFNVSQRVQSLE